MKYKSLFVILTVVLIEVVWRYLIGYFSTPSPFGVNLAFAPLVIPAITSALGAIGNLFGGDPEQERRDRIMKILEARKTQIGKDAEAQGTGLKTDASARIKDRRQNLNAKQASQGIAPTGSVYSNEGDISDSLYSALNTLQANKQKAIGDVTAQEADLEANTPPAESGISKFVGGALKGGNLGFGVNSALGIGLPDLAGGAGKGQSSPGVVGNGVTGTDVNSTVGTTKKGLSKEDLEKYLQNFKFDN